ncbi:hypothetical protein GCM10027614_72940 [Micromonospora vulcania]
MSVLTPLFGVLLVRDLRRAPDAVPVLSTVLAVVLPAVVIGVVGVLICAATLALTPADIADEPWRYAGTVAVGSVLVQIVAGLVGTGLGLLLRSPVVAFLATIVLPLALFALLGGMDAPGRAAVAHPVRQCAQPAVRRDEPAAVGAVALRTADLGCRSERRRRGAARAARPARPLGSRPPLRPPGRHQRGCVTH